MSRRGPGRLRIIGGTWRSRIVAFTPDPGLRVTPDRVRQVLFDWLSPRIEGARCLDLCAGSGALGLEALSRGAASVTFVERDRARADAIRAALEVLAPEAEARVVAQPVESFLSGPPSPQDAVFLDPPYGSGLLAPVLARLGPWLAPDARLYLEWGGDAAPALPDGLTWLKEKRAGQVSYGLACPGAPAP